MGLAAFSLLGWGISYYLLLTVNNDSVEMRKVALDWKHKAGRAYTEMLSERSQHLLGDKVNADDFPAIIPEGSRFCMNTFDNLSGVVEAGKFCDSRYLYPPDNY